MTTINMLTRSEGIHRKVGPPSQHHGLNTSTKKSINRPS
jgi:hypothetical protein